MFLEESEIIELIDRLRSNFGKGTFVFDAVREGYRNREQENFANLEAEIKFHMDEYDFKGLGLQDESIDYLLTSYPERWQQIGIDKSKLTEENSGFIATTLLK